jgi:hypothetical protein
VLLLLLLLLRCVAALPCKEYEAAAEACAKQGLTPYVDLP